jgi:hypothetical protein
MYRLELEATNNSQVTWHMANFIIKIIDSKNESRYTLELQM